MSMAGDRCNICASTLLAADADLYAFPTVTSDCRPWGTGRSVTTCPGCGVTRRVLLSEAAAAFVNVYENYEMFGHAAAATDQINFSRNGTPEGRTQKILKFAEGKLPRSPASVLDIGSGSGAGLLALAHQFPTASIYGFEPNDRPAERQKYLPKNVLSILHQRPSPGEKYDMVTLFHVFEHIDDSIELLDFIASVLAPGGHLLIQVPYPIKGAFDFVVADHLWHFSKKSMVSLLNKSGFTTVYLGNELIEKELTLLATPGRPVVHPSLAADEVQQALAAVRWLVRYKSFLDNVKSDAVAIYGTGPAGAWTGHVLGEKVAVYLDDDPARVNSTFNGKPVLSPKSIGSAMPVIVPFPDYQATWIAEKNQDLNIVLFKDSPYAKDLP